MVFVFFLSFRKEMKDISRFVGAQRSRETVHIKEVLSMLLV